MYSANLKEFEEQVKLLTRELRELDKAFERLEASIDESRNRKTS